MSSIATDPSIYERIFFLFFTPVTRAQCELCISALPTRTLLTYYVYRPYSSDVACNKLTDNSLRSRLLGNRHEGNRAFVVRVTCHDNATVESIKCMPNNFTL